MTWIRQHRPSPGTALGFAALMVALGGVAYATIPDSNGTIHGCYQKNDGALRVVNDAAACRSSEQAIDWNQQGRPGPPGSSVAYDEKAGEVTTDALTPVDLGGPSVTVNVSQSGLIAVFARADLGQGRVTLSEPTDFDPPLSLLANCCDLDFVRGWTETGTTAGTSHASEASRLILEATPGVHTYRLEYQAYASDSPGRFRNRKLWVEPLG